MVCNLETSSETLVRVYIGNLSQGQFEMNNKGDDAKSKNMCLGALQFPFLNSLSMEQWFSKFTVPKKHL